MKRPTRREHCDVKGVCPFMGCRHHLLVEVTDIGTIRATDRTSVSIRDGAKVFERWSDALVEQLVEAEHTCSLDVADEGPVTLSEVGELFGLCRERVRQVQDRALDKARRLSPGAAVYVVPGREELP